jgi:alcohol dehydrogenase (NADP+)
MTDGYGTTFTPAPDGVDPANVPQRLLYTGAKMPAIGLGTFGSDSVGAGEVATAVIGAAEVGYRHFDCGSVYGNQSQIGESLAAVMAGGVPRDELWVTSKLWNDKHNPIDVVPACEQTLRELRLDYLDMYLVHWPIPNHHPPGADVSSRSHNARPYIHEEYMATWREMERLVDIGLVRHIGTSNMTIPKLRLLLEDARIKPATNQMEMHPHFQQSDLFSFVRSHGIEPVAFAPLGSPGRPERDRTSDDTVDMEDPVIQAIARRLGVHTAAVCIKWAIGRGATPIPFSTKRPNYLSNLRAAAGEALSEADMQAIAGIDRNCRLIKGQVFLWRDDQDWEDLWDPGGVIPGW